MTNRKNELFYAKFRTERIALVIIILTMFSENLRVRKALFLIAFSKAKCYGKTPPYF